MPSGFISAVAWLTACILWWSGWRKELAECLPERFVSWMLILWPIVFRLRIKWPAGERAVVWDGAFVWGSAAALAAMVWLNASRRGTAGAASLLIAAVVLFLDQITEHAPRLATVDPLWIVSLTAALIALIVVRNPLERLAALGIGLSLAEAALALGWLGGPNGEAGGLVWSDRWWLAAGEMRLAAYLAAWASDLVRRRGGSRNWG
ncbi:hypothetical protein [Cohnella zeiphila]|uniref:Uncharacterized protein n=1 Tax=Cohnella zeiphila TaxID=2761120 RepID=A0A7X0STE8_9BACL|nr:hypothetical protein [Cohnella zeiphila]MBB6735777.1 hypothetical protein [Cohnella zeiphila]